VKLRELAKALELTLRGDGEREIKRIATIQSAGPGSLCFLANKRYRPYLSECRAEAVILNSDAADESPVAVLISSNPYADYARAAQLLHPPAAMAPGIHPTATIDSSAQIPASSHIAAGAVIGPDVYLGQDVVIGPGCMLHGNVRIGDGSRLESRVVLQQGVRIGARCIVHPGVVIGADGFGFAPDKAGWVKVPQLGGVVIGDEVEIGANTTIDRGTIEDTVIEDGVKLDNQVQVAHNVQIGKGTAIAGCTAIAGSTRIGQGCMIAGGVGIAGHLDIADQVVVTAMTLVSKSIREPGAYSGSMPLDETGAWRRNSARFRKLDSLARRVAALERADRNKGEKDS